MAVAELLSRLQKVKPTGKGRWQACCPAHEDRTPSLAITEAQDGRVLMHCFAQCAVGDIVAAVGMELSDLFPDKALEHGKRMRRPHNPVEILRAVATEARIAAVGASRLARGMDMSPQDRDRLITAAKRLTRASEIASGDW